MQLEEYLDAIEKCPEEVGETLTCGREYSKLFTEFGVYDNWPILFRVNPNFFVDSIKKLDFTFDYLTQREDYLFGEANYNPGTIIIQVASPIEDHGWQLSAIWSKKHHERQMKDYNAGVMLHNYQKKEIEGISDDKAFVKVIGIFGRWAIENKIPLCFPESTKYGNSKDVSQIIYYNP